MAHAFSVHAQLATPLRAPCPDQSSFDPAAAAEGTDLPPRWPGRGLIEALRLQAGEHVLEVGCGHGELGAWVAERLGPKGRMAGVEPLPLRVVMASRRHPRFEVHEGRAEALTAFAAASFDAVYLNGVFPRLAQPSLALSEARRVLRPGGRIGLSCVDAQRPHDAHRLVHQALLDEGLLRETPQARRYAPIGGARLQRLLEDGALIHVEWQARSVTDCVGDAAELLARGRDHGFGIQLSELDEAQLLRLQRRLEALLGARSAAAGWLLQRHFLIATAIRPSYS